MDATSSRAAVEAIADDVDASVEAAPGHDVFERAASVKRVMLALDEAAGLGERDERRRAVVWLRRRLVETIERTPLVAPGGVARHVAALEMLVSLNEAPRSIETDFPGLLEQQEALAARLGLDGAARRRTRHHLVFERYGDLGMGNREAHLHRAFFRLVLGEPSRLGDRAGELYRRMVQGLMGYVDYFLWYHLREQAEARDPQAMRELFARNDAAEVERALHALLGDDEAYARLLADGDLRHGGRIKLVVGRYASVAMDHVRRLALGFDVARWVDLAGGLSTYYLRDLLGLEGRPALCLDALTPDVSCLPHVLPLAIDNRILRLMDRREIDAYAALIRQGAVEHRRVDLLRPGELLAAAPPIDRPTLYTCGGSYLGSIRPEDEALRKGALKRGLSGARVGAMQMSEAIFTALRPGDLLAFFGRAGIPYFRGATWVILAVGPDARVAVRGVGYRTGYPLRVERWELV